MKVKLAMSRCYTGENGRDVVQSPGDEIEIPESAAESMLASGTACPCDDASKKLLASIEKKKLAEAKKRNAPAKEKAAAEPDREVAAES